MVTRARLGRSGRPTGTTKHLSWFPGPEADDLQAGFGNFPCLVSHFRSRTAAVNSDGEFTATQLGRRPGSRQGTPFVTENPLRRGSPSRQGLAQRGVNVRRASAKMAPLAGPPARRPPGTSLRHRNPPPAREPVPPGTRSARVERPQSLGEDGAAGGAV